MHLYVTSLCNMNCLYCSQVPKQANNSKNNFLDLKTSKKYVDLIFSNSKQSLINIVFHGGEPTLQDITWYESLIGYIESQAEKYNKKIDLTMQSNCMKISNEFIDLIKKKDITVGASLDGPPHINNQTRKNGETVINNIIRLKEIDCLGGVICVITELNCDSIEEILSFFEEFELISISFNIFYSVGNGKRLQPLSAQKIFGVYKKTYEYMRSTRGKKIKERSVSIMLSKYLKPFEKEKMLCNLSCYSPFCHAGILTIICDMEGNLFPCGCSDFSKYKLGSIYSLNRDLYIKKLKLLHKTNERYNKCCMNCFANSICSFSCPAFREEDPVTEKNLCEATKMFYRFLESEKPETIEEIVLNSKLQYI